MSRRIWSTSSIPPGGSRWCSACKSRPGEWHEFGHLRLFNEPNEAVVGPTGDLFVLQGHGKGESLVLKFDSDGNFIKTWGKKGKGPGEFDLPHSLVFDAKGLLYIADRNNARIQVFDADGNYIRESKHPGTPCGLFMAPDQTIWLAHGHTGQIMTLDLNGNVLGEMAGARQRQDARQVRRGALHRGQPARRGFRRRHAELARAEVRQAPVATTALFLRKLPDPAPVRGRRLVPRTAMRSRKRCEGRSSGAWRRQFSKRLCASSQFRRR